MRELQRRIKMNWDPPKGNESKRVVLLFKIAKDGRLLSCRVNKSSGLPSADQAALKAVELTEENAYSTFVSANTAITDEEFP